MKFLAFIIFGIAIVVGVSSEESAPGKVPIGSSCTDNRDCETKTNSECIENKCQCKPTYQVDSDGECSPQDANGNPPNKIGSACTGNNECEAITNSECIGSQCQCKTSYQADSDGKTCSPKTEPQDPNVNTPKYIGDPCTNNEECSTNVANSECKEAKCECKESFKAATDNKACSSESSLPNPDVPIVVDNKSQQKIGSACKEGSECGSIQNSICKEQICQCDEKSVASLDAATCLSQVSKLGDACIIDNQCANVGGQCVNNICVTILRTASITKLETNSKLSDTGSSASRFSLTTTSASLLMVYSVIMLFSAYI